MASKSIKPVSINETVLSDLASRFLLNIPKEDQDDPMKLCTHIELAYWFYLDLVRPEDSSLPGCSMKEFMAAMFNHCPFLVKDSMMVDLDNYVAQWKAHKYKKPVRGGIILNQDLTKCLLVQGYPASTTWGFPKGKLEEGENDIDAAVREVFEETGYDSRQIIREKWFLEAQVNGNEAKMYIIPGVPDDTHFEPKTRKEIRNIQWFRVDGLPRHKKDLTSKQTLGKSANSFFMIIPFISQLRKWISSNSKVSARHSKGKTISAHFQNPTQQPSRSKVSAQNVQSPSTSQARSQSQSKTAAAPSAPPLSVISQIAHHYGAGHVMENGESRHPRMEYGSMGMYNSPMTVPGHPQESQSPLTSPLTTTSAFSRDDSAPIPYPPQHPHTLHPNHTLPAPLRHVTTGYYSPGHTAVYPSHLAYANTPHTHHQQFSYPHHQQLPHPSNHQQHPYVMQPVARQHGSTPQYGKDSPRHGTDFGVAHSTSVAPHVQNPAAMYSVKHPSGASALLPAKPPGSFQPIVPGQQTLPHRTPPQAPPTYHYFNIHTIPVAAAPNTAASHPLPAHRAPHPSYYYHHTHLPHPHQGIPLHGQATNGNILGSQAQHHHPAVSSSEHTPTRATNLTRQLPTQQTVSQAHDRDRIVDGVAALSLSQEQASHRQVAQNGGNVTLKPAANMTEFRFNKEAILKASNIKI